MFANPKPARRYEITLSKMSLINSCVAVRTLPMNVDVEIECIAVLPKV